MDPSGMLEQLEGGAKASPSIQMQEGDWIGYL